MNRTLKILTDKAKVVIHRGPKFALSLLSKEINSRKKYNLTHEVHTSFGNEMPDKTFYVIGVDDNWCGLFAILTNKLVLINHAIEHGYIPVIDMQNFYSQYLGDYELFKENAWEYFFEQPMGYGLDDIKEAKNIIKSTSSYQPFNAIGIGYKDIHDANVIDKYKKIFAKNIRINQTSQTFIAEKYKRTLQGKGRVLGIHCRGTDYNMLKPKNHPIQPEPEEVIRKAENVMSEFQCTSIYLATEDAQIYESFLKHFGDKLILDASTRWSIDDLPKGRSNARRLSTTDKMGRYFSGMEYLSQIYLLSQCNCFIGGATRGSFGVLIMPNKFEYQYIYNLGYY